MSFPCAKCSATSITATTRNIVKLSKFSCQQLFPPKVMFGPCRQPGGENTKGAREWAAQVGGEALDTYYAPFVATSETQIPRLIELASVTSADIICDLGCGDGATLCEFVRLTGCTALGCDVDALLLAKGRATAARMMLSESVTLRDELITAYMVTGIYHRLTLIASSSSLTLIASSSSPTKQREGLGSELDNFPRC